MDVIEALNWLARHQPLPSDEELTQEQAAIYNEIRRYFLQHPDCTMHPASAD